MHKRIWTTPEKLIAIAREMIALRKEPRKKSNPWRKCLYADNVDPLWAARIMRIVSLFEGSEHLAEIVTCPPYKILALVKAGHKQTLYDKGPVAAGLIDPAKILLPYIVPAKLPTEPKESL